VFGEEGGKKRKKRKGKGRDYADSFPAAMENRKEYENLSCY
jgi:hypothetical protein